jgi:hypothetical protein
LRDGWAYAEGSPDGGEAAVRFAASRTGQVAASARIAYTPGRRVISLYKIQQVLGVFARVAVHILGFDGVSSDGADVSSESASQVPPGATIEGEVGVDLRDVADAQLWQPEVVRDGDSVAVGYSKQADLFAGDFRCRVPHGLAAAATECLCDLAVQFREPQSGGIMLLEKVVADKIQSNAMRPRT